MKKNTTDVDISKPTTAKRGGTFYLNRTVWTGNRVHAHAVVCADASQPTPSDSVWFSCLQSLPAPSLDRQQAHRHKGRQNQRARCINRRDRVGARVDANNGSHQARNPVQAAGNARPSAAVGRREDLGRVGVQDTVHGHLEEGLQCGTHQLDVGILGGGETEQQNARDQGGDGHRTLAADVRQVDRVPGDQGSGNTADGRDGVVAVGDVGGRVGAQVLRQEGVEQRVAHSDGGPAEPDQDGGNPQTLVGKQRGNLLVGEAFQRPLDDLAVRESLLRVLLGITTDLVQDLLGEPGLGLVLVGDALHRRDGLILPSARHQELGRLVQGEQEEPAEEHGKGDGPQREHEVSPAPVVGLGARGVALTREVGDVGPGQHTGDQRTNRPPGGQTAQQTGRIGRQTFQEDCSIHGKVSTNAQTKAGIQRTGAAMN